MSEWTADSGGGWHVREYGAPLQGMEHREGVWSLWECDARGEYQRITGGAHDEQPDRREACDAAAVAWVLIALAKRAAAYAESIDARMAREYREARTAYLALVDACDPETCVPYASEEDITAARIDMGEAHDALMRGWR